MKGQF